jgi:hypothetical protein
LYARSLVSLNLTLNGDTNARIFEVLSAGGWEANLGYRVDFFPLLVLAMQRLKPGDGWLDTGLLVGGCRPYSLDTLDAFISRVRGMLVGVGIQDGRKLVESRHGYRRLGVSPERVLIEQEP